MATVSTVVTPAPAQASTLGGPISRSEVLSRAQFWVNAGHTYSQNEPDAPDPAGKTYRRDCSGLVSMAWHLNVPRGYVTNEFLSMAQSNNLMHVIGLNELRPGDAMVRDPDGWGKEGHMELFVKWGTRNGEHGAWVYSFNSTGETVQNPYALTNRGNIGFNNDDEMAMYTPIRYNNIIEDGDDTETRVTGDFNGDGRSDVAALYDYGNAEVRLWVFLSGGSSFTGRYIWWSSGPGTWDWNRTKLVVGDFNHDGRSDVGALYDYGNLEVRLFVFLSTGTSFSNPKIWWESGPGNWDWNRTKLTTGDYNGDGITDVAALYDYGNAEARLWVFRSSTTKFNTPQLWWNSGPGGWDWNRTKLISRNFDGSGGADVAALYDYGNAEVRLWVFRSNISTFLSPQIWWESGPGAWDWNRTKLTVGDFNADGRSDVGALYDYGNFEVRLWVFPSNGTRFSGRQIWWESGPGAWDWSRTKLTAGDFNGDGRTDMAAMYDYGNAESRLFVFPSNGTRFSSRQIWWESGPGGWDWNRTKLM